MKAASAIVVGVGSEQGLGGAICRKLATEGYHVFAAGRTAAKLDLVTESIRASGGSADPAVTDASREADVVALFDRAFAPSDTWDVPDLVVFNAGANRRVGLREVSAELFEEFWRVNCFAGFLVGREAVRGLVPLVRGMIVFTGASGSLRGKAQYAQFAASKAGLRMLSQSMAREFGPMGIHVAHVVIDGGIDGERLRTTQPARVAEKGKEGLLQLDAIAENYWHLHRQPRTAWTQELDLRPFAEPF
jgi:NAD(P)-dependent dehydrogenase (short-subunit alcohol dehydrogenase family)